MIPRKVLIYGTSSSGLLVFDEPEFSEVPIQVPGGTVDPDEDIFEAARREFHEPPLEEAALACCSRMDAAVEQRNAAVGAICAS